MAVYVLSESIVSPLGIGAKNNFEALIQGQSGIKYHYNTEVSPYPFWGSVVSEKLLCKPASLPLTDRVWDCLSKLEKMIMISVWDAVSEKMSLISHPKTILIFTSTKGNINLINNGLSEDLYLFCIAEKIGKIFHNPNQVLTVSNACVSGLSGILVGKRLIEEQFYDHAIIVGGDIFSEFTYSGFTSFKAISPIPCRPFDSKRQGITLGEAASAIVLGNEYSEIALSGGSSSNDANHISGPSRTGEGLKLAIREALNQAQISKNELGFISLHGTGTIFNDEMECQALNGLGLENIPAHSLKGYYGHTLGAAGVLESAISIQMIRHGKSLPSRGFEENGTTLSFHVEKEAKELKKFSILKTASGFGGCNVALVFEKANHPIQVSRSIFQKITEQVAFDVEILPGEVYYQGNRIYSQKFIGNSDQWLTQAYRTLTPGYLKFFKMDNLCKLGMLAIELLFKNNSIFEKYLPSEVALLFANRSSSLDTDLAHQACLNKAGNYFPSPAIFVYTLPNIIMGEIAIRYGITGENLFLVLPQLDEKNLRQQVQITFSQSSAKLIIIGWVELLADNFHCKLGFIEKTR